MKATIRQAEMNDRCLRIYPTGRGHYRISCDYRGNTISTITTNTRAIDDFNSELGELVDGCNRIKQGYEVLINEIIRAHESNN